jgi:hypothetical protein
MNGDIILDFLYKEKMRKRISKRGNQFAAGWDEILFPFMKLEKLFPPWMISAILSFMIIPIKIFKMSETSKTNLTHKAGDLEDLDHWRSITFTSVVYPMHFEEFHQ